MVKAILERRDIGDQGVFGILSAPGFTCYTGELPWRDNLSNISCIPTGIYIWDYTWSPRFRRLMYLARNVDGRTGVRIHSANLCGDVSLGWKAQLNGCIALGEKLGSMEGQKCVFVSQPAIRRFERLMNGESFVLEIVNT